MQPKMNKPLISFICLISYSLFVYFLYPSFYEQNLFLANKLEKHTNEMVVLGFFCNSIIAFLSIYVKGRAYYLTTIIILFTTLLPFFILLPYIFPNYVGNFFYWMVFSCAVIFIIIGVIPRVLPAIKTPLMSVKSYSIIIFLINVLSILIIIINYYDIISFLPFKDVYAQRFIYWDKESGYHSYFINWQSTVFSPLLLLFSLVYKKYFFTIISFIGFLLVFMVTAHKISLFIPFMILLINHFKSFINKSSIIAITPLLLLIFLSSNMVDYFNDSPLLNPYISIRIFLIHSFTLMHIYDVFHLLNNNMWSNSFLSFFYNNVFSEDPFIFLAKSVIDRDARFNTSFLGDGYINMKLAGMLFSTFVVGFFLKLFDKLTLRQPLHVFISFYFPFLMMIINVPFQVVLVTNGFLLGFILISIFPKNNFIKGYS